MNMFEIETEAIPVAVDEADVLAKRDLVNGGEIPGFLMPPDLLSELIGVSVLRVTDIMRNAKKPLVYIQLKMVLGQLLRDTFEIDVNSDGFPIHLVDVGVSSAGKYHSHTDSGYVGGVFHLQGKIPKGHSERGVELATVITDYTGLTLPVGSCVPIGTKVYGGIVSEGWGSYFLAKDPDGSNRTLHRFSGYGQFLRFRDYDPKNLEGLDSA